MSLESELQSVQRALQQGDLHEAAELLRRASANHPNDFDVWLSLASAERRLGRPEAAREACQRSIRIAQSAAAYSLLSQCESDLGDLAAAKEAGRRAVNMDSTAVSSRVFLAHLLLKTGHREEAVREFRTAAKFDGNRVRALTSLAHASLIEGNPEESLGFALEAQRMAPANAAAAKAVGAALQQLGRFKEAKSVYLELAHQDPNDARTLFEITQCGPVKADDAVTQLLVSWSPANASHRDRMLIAYARGKADDDLGNFARAKDHFEDANRLADSLIAVPFERAAYKSSIDRTIETFTKEFFRTYVEFGTPFDRPVFIVGMIRSGTTLLERLLAAHPLISPGGEIPFWTEHASKLFDKGRLAGPDESRELVKNYQSILDKVSKSGLVTDKMPLNFSVLGVIHLLLPRAKIIHVVREKRDTMTSIFTTPHPEPINWAHSWERIDFFYRQYERLTRHWHETLDSSIFCEVRYEDLVRQPESVLEILVAFLDLPHDSEIRQEGATKIATPSKWQARQPVHARSIGRWNHYPEWFENL